MPRHDQITRIYTILNLLENSHYGLTVSEIRDQLRDRGYDVSDRTPYRDLEALEQAGFPLLQQHSGDEPSSKWKLERQAKVSEYFILSPKELFALFLARGALEPLSSTPLYHDLMTIFKKLEEKLGTKNLQHLNSLSRELKFEPHPQWGLGLEGDTLELVQKACSESKMFECLYDSANSQQLSLRQLGPHYLYYSKGGLYLVAEDFKDHEIKIFALPRMSQVKILNQNYLSGSILPEQLFKGAFGVYTGDHIQTIQLEFDPSIARYIRERSWHYTQKVVSQTNGSLLLELELAETPELLNWILSYGPMV
jgi:proteasome accessory factor B